MFDPLEQFRVIRAAGGQVAPSLAGLFVSVIRHPPEARKQVGGLIRLRAVVVRVPVV